MAKEPHRIEEARKASNPPAAHQSPREALAQQQVPPDAPVPRPADGEPLPDPQDELRRRLQAQQAQQATQPSPGPDGHPVPGDDRDVLIAELRAKLERYQRMQHAAAGPDERRALAQDMPRGLYRVSLDGAKAQLSSVVVGPRKEPGPLETPVPVGTYDTLALAAEMPGVLPQDAAWRKYAAEHGLDVHRNRSQYRCRMQPGETVSSIVVPAVSPGDAKDFYNRFCGVQASDKPYLVVPVGGAEGEGG